MGTIQFEYITANNSVMSSESIQAKVEELPCYVKSLQGDGKEDLYKFSHLKIRISTDEVVVKQINNFMDRVQEAGEIKQRFVIYNGVKYELHGSIYTSLYKDSIEVYNLVRDGYSN